MDAMTPASPRTCRIDPASVPGWGVDANPRNDPSWPMRDRAGTPGNSPDWQHPAAQRTRIEVLQSVEYKARPAVFGTSVPPGGLSGTLRRTAFRFSESNWWHWLILIGADRVNMVEGLVSDLAKGQPPNLVRETGLDAAWKHDKAGVLKRVAGVAAVAGLATLWLTSDGRRARPPLRRGPRRAAATRP